MAHLPSLYLPHGGGPCFFMDWTMGPPDTWDDMAAFLRAVPEHVGARPSAVLVVSAHWETPVVTVTAQQRPSLLYDYYGFPPHTYELDYAAPGDPGLAGAVCDLLAARGIEAALEHERGLDHGVFIPFKLIYPLADLPVVEMSLRADLDPAFHLRVGRALAPLRAQGVLIAGSGMSYHNNRALLGGADPGPDSAAFDDWLQAACTAPRAQRDVELAQWSQAPAAHAAHPREEHLLPLMVAAGAGDDAGGECIYAGSVLGARVSGWRFGAPAHG